LRWSKRQATTKCLAIVAPSRRFTDRLTAFSVKVSVAADLRFAKCDTMSLLGSIAPPPNVDPQDED